MATPVLPGTPVVCKPGQKTSIVNQGRKKVHMILTDGTEMVDEYDVKTDELLVRKSRKKTTLGGEGRWTFEIGSEGGTNFRADTDLLAPTAGNPVVVPVDTKKYFQFRIRNLPYPASTYQLSVDEASQTIVVRTTNKKYFKKIEVPAMQRACLGLQEDNVQWEYKNNTLVIDYAKPPEILQQEAKDREERTKMKSEDRPGDECKTQ